MHTENSQPLSSERAQGACSLSEPMGKQAVQTETDIPHRTNAGRSMTNDARRIAKNSVFQAAALITQGLSEMIIGLFLARLAGAERLGQFTTLVTLAGLFAFVSDFGLPGLLTREIARRRQDKDQIAKLVQASIGLVAVLSGLAMVLMFLLWTMWESSNLMLRSLILTALALGFESMAMVVSASFRGIEELQWSAAVIAAMQTSFLGMALVIIPLGLGIDWLMAAYLLSRILALVTAAWLYQRSGFGRLHPTFSGHLWRELLTKGVPFSVNSVFSFAYSRIDVVLLSVLVGNVFVGYYEAAYTLTMRLNILARTVTFALYPFLSAEFVRDKRMMYASTARSIHYLVIPGFLIATVYWVFGDRFLLLMYGESFARAAGPALKILALAIPLRFIETSLSVALDASNLAGYRATAVAMAAVLNLVLNVILIPFYQIEAAAYVTLSTEVFICGLLVWCLRREIREMIEWRDFVAPSLGILWIIGAPALLGSLDAWVLILCILLYGLTIVVVDRRCIEDLRVLTAKRPLLP